MTRHMHGFTITSEQELPELAATLVRMTHDQTGLELAWLNREEENKTFGIAFQTLPWDDSGVFHIIEHSVLCGSDRYPVKEPFLEMMKGSMNTFLNAMTGADKTIYPVSSRNDQDLYNLMRVYLDGVFHPLMYSRPEIFRQEGWHYEISDEGELSYNGVVFNEMKGALASDDEQTAIAMNRLLFPDTPYRFISGGDPAAIPTLTEEAFLAAHRRCYTPSNARVFLDGSVDIDTILTILNDEYLSTFGRTERLAPPSLQAPVTGSWEGEYEQAPGEPLEGKNILTLGYVLGRYDDRVRRNAAAILGSVLTGSNQSPLARVILSEQLAEDITINTSEGLQPTLMMEVRNFREENLPRIREVIQAELIRLCEEGLDHDQLRAIIANQEFRYRERDYGSMPVGLLYGFVMLDPWMYDDDPAAGLESGELFSSLRRMVDEGGFERLLRELLLENPHHAEVLLRPSHTLGEERRAAEQARLAAASANWTEADFALVRETQARQLAYQAQDNSPEALATIPQLTLKDIPPEPQALPLVEENRAGLTVLHHPQATSGIVYATLYFDANGCTEEELSRMAFVCDLLRECDTTRHTAEEMLTLQRLNCGGLSVRMTDFWTKKTEDAVDVRLKASFSALSENLFTAWELLLERLTCTVLEERRTREVLRQQRQDLVQSLTTSGVGVAADRVRAQVSPVGVADDHLDGLEYLRWLKNQDENWDFPALREAMISLLQRLLNSRNLVLSLTGADEGQREELARRVADAFPAREAAPVCHLKPYGRRAEGIAIPADTCFAVIGADHAAHGGECEGAASLAAKVLSLEYLWNVIRVQGGAYGADLQIAHTGLMIAYSYRDPDGAASLKKFAGAPAFLRAYAASGADLTGLIIGAVADRFPLTTPRTRANSADGLYFQGRTWEERCESLRSLLNATEEDLLRCADDLERSLADAGVCVIGGETQLAACEGLDEILTV